MYAFNSASPFDFRSVSVMGLTAKPNTDSPIGKFGTGLKYSIAIVLRLGGEFEIFSGTKKYVFFVKKETFRDAEYDAIACSTHHLTEKGYVFVDTQEMPFTTNYGSHWPSWTVLRELISNTRDEDGTYEYYGDDTIHLTCPKVDGTLIRIWCDELDALHDTIDTIFLDDTKHKIVGGTSSYGFMYEGADQYQKLVYNKGIRAHEERYQRRFRFIYDLTQGTLNEDRTLQHVDHYVSLVFLVTLRSAITAEDDKAIELMLGRESYPKSDTFSYQELNFDLDALTDDHWTYLYGLHSADRGLFDSEFVRKILNKTPLDVLHKVDRIEDGEASARVDAAILFIQEKLSITIPFTVDTVEFRDNSYRASAFGSDGDDFTKLYINSMQVPTIENAIYVILGCVMEKDNRWASMNTRQSEIVKALISPYATIQPIKGYDDDAEETCDTGDDLSYSVPLS